LQLRYKTDSGIPLALLAIAVVEKNNPFGINLKHNIFAEATSFDHGFLASDA
jgi:hypothetical protein